MGSSGHVNGALQYGTAAVRHTRHTVSRSAETGTESEQQGAATFHVISLYVDEKTALPKNEQKMINSIGLLPLLGSNVFFSFLVFFGIPIICCYFVIAVIC